VRGLSNALALPIVESKDLREIDVGIWQGTEIEEVKRRYPVQIAHYKESPATFRFEGGEAYADVAARALRAVTEISERHAGGTVAIATHGGVIRALRAMAGGGIEAIGSLSILPNASLCVAEHENGALRFTELGVTSFLTGDLAETEEGVK
jgi:broad specificity phosphatase PhoE